MGEKVDQHAEDWKNPQIQKLEESCAPILSTHRNEPPKKKHCTMTNDDDDGQSKFVFFWKPEKENGFLGNWYPSPFGSEGTKFDCVEQWIMWSKAKLFHDEENGEKILATSSPKVQKSLGRKVQNFDQKVWDLNKERILYEGLLAKFTHHKDLREKLLDTGNKILVEASPLDRIYGIGLGAGNPNATNPAKWRGQNLLGNTLMKVRDDIQKKEKNSPSTEADS